MLHDSHVRARHLYINECDIKRRRGLLIGYLYRNNEEQCRLILEIADDKMKGLNRNAQRKMNALAKLRDKYVGWMADYRNLSEGRSVSGDA